jgi:hypothetical protein
MGIVEGTLIALAAAGTATSVYSQQKQAKQADAIADQQTQTAREDAAYAASDAQLQAKAIRKASDKQRAEARASLSGAGVVVGQGTAEQIDTEIQTDSEQDALLAIYDGTNRARSINQSGNLAAERSRNAASAARTGALTSALQGGATIARGWNTSGTKA